MRCNKRKYFIGMMVRTFVRTIIERTFGKTIALSKVYRYYNYNLLLNLTHNLEYEIVKFLINKQNDIFSEVIYKLLMQNIPRKKYTC